jgi:phosphodiester glycosidase
MLRYAAIALSIGAAGCTSTTGAPSASPRQPSGQLFDSVTTRVIAPGLVHRRLVAVGGPWTVNVLEIDLRRRELGVDAARALDSLRGRERVSSMARRHGSKERVILAAVNADFFDVRTGTGENENNQIVGGELLKALRVTDSPYDSLHTVHSQFGMTCAGRPVIDRFAFDGVLLGASREAVPVHAVNFRALGDALVLFTGRYGDRTPTINADSTHRTAVELPLASAGTRGDTLLFRVSGAPRDSGGLPLDAAHSALSATGSAADALRHLSGAMRVGDTTRVVLRFRPDRGRLCTLVGGWPRIVVDGTSIADSVDRIEGTFPRFSVTRHPRTAVGISRDSTKLLLTTVDGRQESSSGMSLVELAALMRALGAFQAINLDGGGSTTMVIEGQVVNHPSDSAGERAVGNALLVVRRAR